MASPAAAPRPESRPGPGGGILIVEDEAERSSADLGLPDIDGTEVIVELRRWYHAPIIVLSGRTSPGDKIGALDVGADGYRYQP